MAELSGSPGAEECCSSERQQACCEPSAKAESCGREEGCGCAAPGEPAYAADAALGSSSSTAFSSSTDW
jgi:hypothetical protein